MSLMELLFVCVTGFAIGFTYIMTNKAKGQTKCISQNTQVCNNTTKCNKKVCKSVISNNTSNHVNDDTCNESDWEDISSCSDDNNDNVGKASSNAATNRKTTNTKSHSSRSSSSEDELESSEESSDDDDDDEYNYYAERNFKMILIVCQDSKPKLCAREVAQYAATAAVGVIQKILNTSTSSFSKSRSKLHEENNKKSNNRCANEIRSVEVPSNVRVCE